ncbi:MAG: queuosine precursor transporter [Pseudomonadota bacterium]
MYSALMAFVICISNYLVQFPFEYFGLNEILTWGAFTYPVTFLVTDLANRFFGKEFAKKIVFFGFVLGITLSFILTFEGFNLIVLRIVVASGAAFLAGQLLDIRVFDILRNKLWFIPPIVSSILGSILDTVIFFSIAFYGTDSSWVVLALGDLAVKLFVDFAMLLPFRIAIARFN